MSAQSRIDAVSSARSSSCELRAIMRCSISSRTSANRRLRQLELARDLRRLQIVVHQPAGLVLDLVRRDAVLAPGRRQHAVALFGDVGGIEFREIVVVGELHCVLACDRAVGEGAEHVVVRHARHVAGGIKPGHRGARELVDEHAGGAVSRAKADLGDVHLDRSRYDSRCRAPSWNRPRVGRSTLCSVDSISSMVFSCRCLSLRNTGPLPDCSSL